MTAPLVIFEGTDRRLIVRFSDRFSTMESEDQNWLRRQVAARISSNTGTIEFDMQQLTSVSSSLLGLIVSHRRPNRAVAIRNMPEYLTEKLKSLRLDSLLELIDDENNSQPNSGSDVR